MSDTEYDKGVCEMPDKQIAGHKSTGIMISRSFMISRFFKIRNGITIFQNLAVCNG